MPDDLLRELERRFHETGAPEDEAAWLRARLQAGRITENQLRLRAYDKNEAARLALGDWKDDNAWFYALKEKHDRAKADRFAEAKAEAAKRGKEPFDIEALAKIYPFPDPYTAENYRKYANEYEYEYYVTWPKIMTIAQFAEHRKELDVWG